LFADFAQALLGFKIEHPAPNGFQIRLVLGCPKQKASSMPDFCFLKKGLYTLLFCPNTRLSELSEYSFRNSVPFSIRISYEDTNTDLVNSAEAEHFQLDYSTTSFR